MKSASAFVAAAIFSVFAAGTELSLTGQERSEERSTFTNLTLEIALTKSEFVPLEPIPIVVTLRNSTTKNIAWGHAFTPNHTELFVISSGGPPQKIDFHKPIRELIEVSPYPKVLRPGDAENLKPLINMGLNDILSQPGDYRIQALTHGANWNEEIRSKPVLVRIVKPQGVNEQVFNYIRRTTSYDLFAGWDLSENQEMLNALEAVANEFVNSATVITHPSGWESFISIRTRMQEPKSISTDWRGSRTLYLLIKSWITERSWRNATSKSTNVFPNAPGHSGGVSLMSD